LSRLRRRLLLCGAAALVVASSGVFSAAWWLTKSWPSPAVALPADVHGEDVAVPWREGTLRAWVIESEGDAGVVLLLHGWRGRRQWMLERGRLLMQAGFSVVIPDLPAHGESTGDSVTFGQREGEAVDALLDYTRTRFSGEPLGAIGVSLGGEALLMARRDVALRAVVLESVFPTLRQGVDSRMRRFLGPAGPALTPLLEFAAFALRGISTDAVRPIDRIGSLGCPLLCLHGSDDRSTPIEQARALFDAAREPKEFWEVAGAEHEDLCDAARAEYERRVVGFLKRNLAKD
jgi:pimeloyl-ACP methyl ester carboxylesterase